MQPQPTSTRRRLSLRTALLGATACLGLLAAGSAARNAAEGWDELRRVERARDANLGANQFAAGLFEVLMERLATNNALQAADPAPPAVLEEIARRRAAVQANFYPGLTVISLVDFPDRQARLGELRAALDRANEMRRRADDALRLPRDRRDEALRREYVPTITASVNAALSVWFVAVHAAASADPALARLAVLKELGWRMRDVAGFERSNVASSISAGEPVSAQRQAQNAAVRAQVDLLWSQFASLAPASDPATPAALREAAEVARREYFGGFRQLVDELTRAEGRYNTDTARFVDTTTRQLGTLLAVMHAASSASEAHAGELVAHAQAGLATTLAVLLLTLLLVAGSSWLVLRRVARPLGVLRESTARLAAGDLDTPVPTTGRRDEIDAVAQALDALRDSTRRGRKLEAEAAEAARLARAERQALMVRLADSFGASVAGVTEQLGEAARTARDAAQSSTQAMARTQSARPRPLPAPRRARAISPPSPQQPRS
jgi:HAMP domain-containing protein